MADEATTQPIAGPFAVNRTPFDALVDDDGSNTIGTPWNKQAIKDVILDPVDAAIAPLAVYGFWSAQAFNTLNFTTDLGAWGVTADSVIINQYTLIGKTLWWMLRLYNTVAPPPGSSWLLLKMPAGLSAVRCVSPLSECVDGGTFTPAAVVIYDANRLLVAKQSGQPWAGALIVSFTATIQVL
jgi:hypothetical protein